MLSSNKYILELNDVMKSFYKNDTNAICCVELGDDEVEEIVTDCEKLISVLLINPNTIYIFYKSIQNELILYILKEDVYKKNIIMRNIFSFDYLEIVSINNTLNLFYTKYTNNGSMLFHRVISSELTISSPFLVDIIEDYMERPFFIYTEKGMVYISFIRKLGDYYLGYRIYNVDNSAWGSFREIDYAYTKINDYSIIFDEGLIYFAYIVNNNKIGYLKYGMKSGDYYKSNYIQNADNLFKYCNLLFLDKKLYFSYSTVRELTVETLSYSNTREKILSILIEGESIISKPLYDQDRSNNINNVILIEGLNESTTDLELIYEKQFNISEENMEEFQKINLNYNELERRLFEREQKIVSLTSKIEELQKRNLVNEERLKEVMQINNRDEEIDKNISELYDEMVKREKKILELQNYVTNKEEILVEKEKTLLEKEKKIEEMNSNIIKLREEIVMKGQNLQKASEEILNLKNRIKDFKVTLEEKEKQINNRSFFKRKV